MTHRTTNCKRKMMKNLFVSVWLILTRIPQLGLKGPIKSVVISVKGILGIPEAAWNFAILNNPGVAPFILIVLLSIPLYGLTGSQVKEIFVKSGKQVYGATIALIFGFGLVYMYRWSSFNGAGLDSMLLTMAKGVAELAGENYFYVAPFIGSVGAFMFGSNTVSNVMFAPLQFETANLLQIPPTVIGVPAMGALSAVNLFGAPAAKAIDLEVDGYWGSATTSALQEVLGTPVDGIVSSQNESWRKYNPALTSGWKWIIRLIFKRKITFKKLISRWR